MIDFGTVRPGTTLYVPFSSFASATGASITMTNFLASDIEIYKDGGTTQRASDNGYTLLDTDGTDFDGLTGIHGFSISLADNSTAGFYAAGSDYFVVVSTVTVDTQTVSFLAARFTIGYPAAILNTTIATLSSQTSFTLTAGPAEDDALNGLYVIIHDVASAVQLGCALILDYTGSTKTVTLAGATTYTAAATDNCIVMGMAPLQPTTIGRALDVSTGGEAGLDWANIGSPTTAQNLSATNIDVDQVVASVSGAVGSVTGAVGSVTGNVGGNVTGSVGSVVGAVGSVTGAVGSVTGNVGGLVTGSVGSVLGGVAGSVGSVVGAVGSVAANGISASSLAADAGAEIADAVWDEAIAGHLTAGTTGAALNSAGSAGDPWGTALPGAYGAGTAGKIVGDNVNATISSRATPAQVNTEADTALADAGVTTTVTGRIDAAISTRAATGAAMTLTSGERDSIANALLDLSNAVETGLTTRGALRLALAALAGKLSGAGTATEVMRNAVLDSKARITATVDADGNRTAITADTT